MIVECVDWLDCVECAEGVGEGSRSLDSMLVAGERVSRYGLQEELSSGSPRHGGGAYSAELCELSTAPPV